MQKEEFRLYVIAEMNYMKKNAGRTESELFPMDWYNIKDYKLKTRLISESLKQRSLIKDTTMYKETIGKENSRRL